MTTLVRCVWMREEARELAVLCENGCALYLQAHFVKIILLWFVKCSNLHALTTRVFPVPLVVCSISSNNEELKGLTVYHELSESYK